MGFYWRWVTISKNNAIFGKICWIVPLMVMICEGGRSMVTETIYFERQHYNSIPVRKLSTRQDYYWSILHSRSYKRFNDGAVVMPSISVHPFIFQSLSFSPNVKLSQYNNFNNVLSRLRQPTRTHMCTKTIPCPSVTLNVHLNVLFLKIVGVSGIADRTYSYDRCVVAALAFASVVSFLGPGLPGSAFRFELNLGVLLGRSLRIRRDVLQGQ